MGITSLLVVLTGLLIDGELTSKPVVELASLAPGTGVGEVRADTEASLPLAMLFNDMPL